MKITLTFKTPDVIDNAIEETVNNLDSQCDIEYLKSQIREDLTSRWISYGEFITVEFDLTNMTAKVLTR